MAIGATAAALAACGSGGSSGSAPSSAGGISTANGVSITKAPRDSVRAPRLSLPPGPPPTKLIVKDIKRGSGPALHLRPISKIVANYTAISYPAGKLFETRWTPTGAFQIEFGPSREVKGWEKGLVGMRAGGRRELIVPSRMAYDRGAIVYVIDLLKVIPPHVRLSY